jgi:hypothetical protein
VAIAAGMAVTQNIKSLTVSCMDIGGNDDFISFNAALRTITSFVEESRFYRARLGDACGGKNYSCFLGK